MNMRILILSLLLLGCGGKPSGPSPAATPMVADAMPGDSLAGAAGFILKSDSLNEGGAIPQRYACEGLDLSPPLSWTAPPPGTASMILLVQDPDAPDPAAPTMTWTHWLLLNLPPVAGHLPEQAGNSGGAGCPAGSVGGLNDWQRTGWGGPCPPVGRHRYRFLLYALDTLPPPRADWTREQVEVLSSAHALAVARLTGTYQKHQP